LESIPLILEVDVTKVFARI